MDKYQLFFTMIGIYLVVDLWFRLADIICFINRKIEKRKQESEDVE